MTDQNKLNDYDSEPVRYCMRCYSLKIKYEEAIDSECCGDCGCSDIDTTTIEEWENKYQRRYGNKFVVKSNDPKASPIFKMSLEKIKTKVYKSDKWKELIHKMYPRFPKGLSKTDSILMFFDKLIKDNKIDDFKMILYKNNF